MTVGMDRITQLAAVIDRHVSGTGICTTAMSHVSLIRADQPSTPTPAVYEASLCLIAQGSKRVSIGEHSVVYVRAGLRGLEGVEGCLLRLDRVAVELALLV